MELVFERRPSRVDGFAPIASVCGVAALYYEIWHETVEQCTIVVAIKAVLKEVAACERRLFGEELE